MLYQRSLEIEQRLRLILELIGTGEYSTPRLAEQVGVSVPTISRDVQALRERGHEIRSERNHDGWRYVLAVPRPRSASHQSSIRKRVPK
jgi:biotin operon repressor